MAVAGYTVHAQDADPEAAKLTAEIELLKKKLEKVQAEKALADATAPPNKETAALGTKTDLLKKQTDQAKAEADKAKAEKDRFEAQLPTPKTQALNGDLKIDDKVDIDVEILSHQAVRNIAGRVGARIAAAKPKTIVFYNEREFANVQAAKIAANQMGQLDKAFDQLLTDAAPSVEVVAALLPEVAGTILKSVIDLISLFRTDVEIKGKTVTIEDIGVLAQVAREIRRRPEMEDVQIFQPSLLPPDGLSSDARILKSIGALQQKVERAKRKAEELDKSSEQTAKSRSAKLKALNEQTEAFLAGLQKLDSSTGQSPLFGLIRGERLGERMDKDTSYTLFVKLLKAAGNNKTSKNLITGSKLSHSGGAILTFALFDRNNNMTDSGTLAHYNGYIRSKSKDGVLLSSEPD